MAQTAIVCVYFRMDPRESHDVIPTATGYDICTSGYRIDRKSFHGYGLEFVTKGKGFFKDATGIKPISAGMVFCYSKHAPHSYWTDPKMTLEKHWIAFQGTDAVKLMKGALGALAGTFYVMDVGEIRSVFEAVLHEAKHNNAFTTEIGTYYLKILLRKIQVNLLPSAPRGNASQTLYRNCRMYIDENFENMQSPFDASRSQSITDSYLCQLFRRFAGISPHQYLLTLKMSHAAHELTNSDRPVKRISIDLSFRDQYAFSRAFKRHYGLSPQHYRQQR